MYFHASICERICRAAVSWICSVSESHEAARASLTWFWIRGGFGELDFPQATRTATSRILGVARIRMGSWRVTARKDRESPEPANLPVSCHYAGVRGPIPEGGRRP